MNTALFLVALVAFLLGSLPFGYLLARALAGVDLRRLGSGNIGATNASRVLGRPGGALVLVLDAGKGYAAVAMAPMIETLAGAPAGGGQAAALAAAAAAVLGHVFTPWLGGRGGKGVATTFGAFAAIEPLATALAAMAFLLTLWRTGFVSVASLAGLAALAMALTVIGTTTAPALVAALLLLLALWRHRGNLERLRSGLEPRLAGPGTEGRR